MTSTTFLAIDLGAASGRAILGELQADRLTLTEAYRFPNGPVQLRDGFFWDAPRIYEEIKTGLARSVPVAGGRLASMGIDTWGVDFGLLTASGVLMSLPRHYRDPRNDQAMAAALRILSRERIYSETGSHFMAFNTIYQLLALQAAEPELLAGAHTLLMMGELFTYFFTGTRLAELTLASTSQLLNPATGNWADPLFTALDLPRRIMPPIVPSGTLAGEVLPAVAAETGCGPLPVMLPAVHDTASAVAAVPAEAGGDWCFISSGTWSLIGLERPTPLTSSQALAANVTNEAGVGGTWRLLKNLMGMWILQECRRQWEHAGQTASWEELMALAEAAPPFAAFIDPDDPLFMPPGDMMQRIQHYCQSRGQVAPAGIGAITRCVLESLALKYRFVLDQLVALTGQPVAVVHIVGGGCRNALLNQMTANSTNRPVAAGPTEATAIGNIIMQAIGLGVIESVAAGRHLVRSCFAPEIYEPREPEAWNAAYRRFTEITARPAE